MRRIITSEWQGQAGVAVAHQPQDQHHRHQALLAHKAATLELVLSQLHDTNTFREIGDLIHRSDEFVRKRLRKKPELLYMSTKPFSAPRAVAEAFIREWL